MSMYCEECPLYYECENVNCCEEAYQQGRVDERRKTLDELTSHLLAWDHNVNAIPNYVWNCIKKMKGDVE